MHNTNKDRKFPIEILTAPEVRALLRATSKRGLCGVRDRALIAVLYSCGLRIAEALALLPKDVDLDSGVITVLLGKGAKRREVGVDHETVALIQHWLATRKANGVGSRAPLFCTLKGSPMMDRQVRHHLAYLAAKAGIEKRVHPHGLRHSFAASLADEKTDLRIVQGALGHTSLATTDRYIKHLRPTAVLDTMRSRSWLSEEA